MSDDDDRPVRRRTSFEKDFREFLLKVFIGGVIGVGFHVFSGWAEHGSIWVPLALSWLGVFWLASMIRGDGRHAD